MTDLVIVHLYPRLLRTYGDRGNVMALSRRAEWRGFRVRVDEVDPDRPIPPDAGIVLLGGGTDRIQHIVGGDLASRRSELRDAAARGVVILGICGGYQLLGHRYVTPQGAEIEGLSLLDAETIASERRIVGRVRARARLWGHDFEVVGFENHGGRTSLGPAAAPLAGVPRGCGNDGRSGTEGAVQGAVVGTYLHGPVLPANPQLADAILEKALGPITGGGPLAPLPDHAERRALAETLRRPDEVVPRRRKVAVLAAAALVLLGTAGGAGAAELRERDRASPAARCVAKHPTEDLLPRTRPIGHDPGVPHGGSLGWSIRCSASAACRCWSSWGSA